MTTIIDGRFQQQDAAKQALSELTGAGFAQSATALFFVNPPGQHAQFPIGGDEDESPGTEHAAGGSATQAAVGGAIGVAVGLATLPLLGPGAAVAAAGVGAYGGALYGALHNTDDKSNPATPAAEAGGNGSHRHSGVVVAVAAPSPEQQAAAVRILRARGAADIESAEGTIVAGEWIDFDPLTPLKPIAN
ncbi:MAG: hypothetical protein ABIS45_04680 [Burkholderiales bacterium]